VENRRCALRRPNYVVEQDVKRDGAIDVNGRLTLQVLTGNAAQTAVPAGLVSFKQTGSGGSLIHGPDNPIAWDGYVFNPETTQYTVRFRWYDPVLGRWLERDPLGYVDGTNLLQMTGGHITFSLDPMGLAGNPPCKYDLQVTDDFNESFGTWQGGRRLVRRHFYNEDRTEYLGYIEYDPCDGCDLATIEQFTKARDFLNTVSTGAHNTRVVGGLLFRMSVEVALCYAPIHVPLNAMIRGTANIVSKAFSAAVISKMVQRGATLARTGAGEWVWKVGNEIIEKITNTRALAALSELEGHHLLPQDFRAFFESHGLSNIDDYILVMDKASHRLKSGQGVHCSSCWNKTSWNKD